MNGDSNWQRDQELNGRNDSSNRIEGQPGEQLPGGGRIGGGEPDPGFLEWVYGALFEPAGTMKKVAEKPPLGTAVLVVALLTLLGAVMGFLTASRVLTQGMYTPALENFLPALRATTPFWVILSLFWGFAKWFGYSALLHLAADLLGGRGSARGVFATVGLAGLPSLFMAPAQVLAYWFGESAAATALVGLAGLAAGIWSAVLLVIGLKQVHGLSTGHAVLVVLSPALALLFLLTLLLIAVLVFVAFMPAPMHFPGYF